MKIAEVCKTVSNTSKHQSSTILVHEEINRLQENQEGDGGQEKIFERKDKVDRIQSLNNFEFETKGFVTSHRAYKIGSGKVRTAKNIENI